MEEEESFENAVKPLIKWLNENANPHAVIVVEVGGAVLYSGDDGLKECLGHSGCVKQVAEMRPFYKKCKHSR
ncbi:TPA: hypothetical protein MO487_000370 [Salmonella enterica subsp. houtenae serovar 43:z4,z23:-]|nr:hypothetical protein [Salmonella enterica]EMC3044767.1 hypothetical protein [Salmonella enterica]HCA3674623.1 hypothetical protein [Salmonella enterica subsp. houtenae serovar Houten]